MPGLPLGRKNAPVFHKVHEILRKVFHRLGGRIGADMPAGAVFTHRFAVIVSTIKVQPKFSFDHQILVMMSQLQSSDKNFCFPRTLRPVGR